MSELLPCPFCGKPPEIRRHHTWSPPGVVVRCGTEHCAARVEISGNNPLDGIRRWNTRAASPASKPTGEDWERAVAGWKIEIVPDPPFYDFIRITSPTGLSESVTSSEVGYDFFHAIARQRAGGG